MTPELKVILEGLKREYLKNMPEKFETVTRLWRAGEIDLLETEFHKLKGTGKTYGLPEVSELGLVAEELCSADGSIRDRAVELTLEIMRKIHETRLAGNEFDLTKSKEFAELTKLRK